MPHDINRTCDSRKYTYFFPTYLLIPPRPGSGLFCSLRRQNGEPPAHRFWDFLNQMSGDTNGDVSDQTEFAPRLEELRLKRGWRISVTELNTLRAVVKRFEGTHNFHNFTVEKDFRDRSNQRHMKSIQVADPVVHGETEWISVLLHGQSFMLHQVFSPQYWITGISHRLIAFPPKDRAYGFTSLSPHCIRYPPEEGGVSFFIQRKMMAALILSVRTETPPNVIDEVTEDLPVTSNTTLFLLLISDVRPQRGDDPQVARTRSPP